MEAGKILEIMRRLETLPYQKILFDGVWGIGKTNYIKKAIKNREHIYYLSMFGKKNIEQVYDELYYQMVSKQSRRIRELTKKLRNINVSANPIIPISISIPIITDVMISIQKKLNTPESLIVVFDDLERKHDTLEISEIFGLIDSLTTNDHVKVVLVTSSKNLSESSLEVYEEYLEKTIDRKFTITQYATEAPVKILGENVYSALENFIVDTGLDNLRTLEKVRDFINEVLKELPNEIYSEKISKVDIYRICFAVLVFCVEDNYKLKRLPKGSNDKDGYYSYYKDINNYPDYIRHHLLQRKLDNNKMGSFISIILELYSTGIWKRDQVPLIIKQLNAEQIEKEPFFMSEKQLRNEVENLTEIVNQIDEITLKDKLKYIDNLLYVAEKFEIYPKINKDRLVKRIIESSKIESVRLISDLEMYEESSFMKQLNPTVKIKSEEKLKEKLLEKMVENMKKDIFQQSDFNSIQDYEQIIILQSVENRDKNEFDLIDNQFLIPNLAGEITDSKWRYSHQLFIALRNIYGKWDKKPPVDKMLDTLEYQFNKNDIMFHYRVKSLIKQYLI